MEPTLCYKANGSGTPPALDEIVFKLDERLSRFSENLVTVLYELDLPKLAGARTSTAKRYSAALYAYEKVNKKRWFQFPVTVGAVYPSFSTSEYLYAELSGVFKAVLQPSILEMGYEEPSDIITSEAIIEPYFGCSLMTKELFLPQFLNRISELQLNGAKNKHYRTDKFTILEYLNV